MISLELLLYLAFALLAVTLVLGIVKRLLKLVLFCALVMAVMAVLGGIF